MTRWTTRTNAPATPTTLSTATQQRIHRLVLRVFHHAFGADAALRTAVRSGATEMLRVGASREAVRHAIAECLVQHPSSLPDKPSLLTGESRAASVLGRMLAWTDQVSPPVPHSTAP